MDGSSKLGQVIKFSSEIFRKKKKNAVKIEKSFNILNSKIEVLTGTC